MRSPPVDILCQLCSVGRMRRSQSSATSFHAQRDDQAMLRALSKRPGEPIADKRISEQHCKLPRMMPQDKARSSSPVDDEDQWSDVCEEEYRDVVQRGKELWRDWSSCSVDVTRESISSRQSAWPEVPGDSSAVFRTSDKTTGVGGSDQVDQILARPDHQPVEGSVDAPDPLRDHAASAPVLQIHKRVAPQGEQRRELSGPSLGELHGVVSLQRDDSCTDKQLPVSLPCDVSAPPDIYEGIEVCPNRHGRPRKKR